MKGKINFKTIVTIAIFLLVLVLLVIGVNVARNYLIGATVDYEPKNLLATAKEDGKSVMISWTTDKAVKASIFYGTNMASLLLMAEDNEPTIEHQILLTNLRTNTTYFYKVVVDNDNIFDNGGSMFSFKTGGTNENEMSGDEKPVVTIAPEVETSLVPTISTVSSFRPKCERTVDYNKDGTVNSLDYILCAKGKITPEVGDACSGDYNKDGVINSLDKIKCLQDSKR